MFGLAIWDEKKQRLMLARDRLGIKMVYYTIKSGCLYFGSEIRALLACQQEKPEVDPVALNLFLRYRFTPSPLTLFQGIRKLAPGTRLIVENGTARVERWWDFKPVPFDPMPTLQQAEEELRALYQRAVNKHLISDVPVGLLLSGGLDSGLLLAFMNHNDCSWKTFTVGYGKSYADDELADAARTAKFFNAAHASVEIDHETFEASLQKIVSFLEEPIASPSVVPMYHLCERARQEVKVALIGQGPDELFGGYRRHLGVYYGACWRALPQWLRAPLGACVSATTRSEWVKRGLHSLDVPQRMKRYQQVFSIVTGEVIDDLFQDGILSPQKAGDTILDCWHDLEPLMENSDELAAFQFLEIRSTLPDELLMYADKLSMANSLEVRVPYLDHEIVEYVERLPASFKIRYGTGKWLHREVCKNFLPREIIQRKKRGFGVNVVDEWFRHAMAGTMDNMLLDRSSCMYKYLRPEKVEPLVIDHRA
ncbi:MAG: asparagine synthase (glutamine-hydrolyzing), partial [bacterium]